MEGFAFARGAYIAADAESDDEAFQGVISGSEKKKMVKKED